MNVISTIQDNPVMLDKMATTLGVTPEILRNTLSYIDYDLTEGLDLHDNEDDSRLAGYPDKDQIVDHIVALTYDAALSIVKSGQPLHLDRTYEKTRDMFLRAEIRLAELVEPVAKPTVVMQTTLEVLMKNFEQELAEAEMRADIPRIREILGLIDDAQLAVRIINQKHEEKDIVLGTLEGEEVPDVRIPDQSTPNHVLFPPFHSF